MSKATQIRKVLEHDRADEAVTIRFHEIISAYAKAHEGQKPSRRVVTAIQKALGDDAENYSIWWENTCGMYHVVVWPKADRRDDNKWSFLVGYESDTLGADTFEERDICHGRAARERNRERIRLAASRWPEETGHACEELDTASRTAHRMLADCPSQYAIKAELGVV